MFLHNRKPIHKAVKWMHNGRHRLCCLILLCLISIVSELNATTSDGTIRLYDKWSNLTSEQLMLMGERYRMVYLQPDSAMVCFSIVANRYYQGYRNRDDIKLTIRAMTHISWLYSQNFYDYVKAFTFNTQAHELADKYNCFDYMPFIILNEANIVGLYNSFLKSKNNVFNNDQLGKLKKAFYIAQEQKNTYALHVIFMNMVISTIFQDKEALIDKEMDIVRHYDIPDSVTAFKYDRCLIDGIRAWNNNQRDSAFNCFNRLLAISHDFNYLIDKAQSQIVANNILFFCYGDEAQHNKALNALKANEQIAKQVGLPVHLLDAYKNQENVYRFLGKEQEANRYHLLYLEGEDSLLTEKRLGSVQETRFLYQLNRKNEQVRELAAREQLQHKVMWGALVFSLVLLVLMALLVVSYRRVQRHNRYLYEKSLDMIRAGEQKHELVERLQQAEVLAGTAGHRDEDTTGTVGKMDEDKMSDLLHRVFIVMETSHEIYSPDFSLPRLAELVGDRRNNVSEAINRRYKSNFNGLLNEYRIREACRRINDPEHYGNLTIEAIGQSVGFKSNSNFVSNFKKIIGLTPSTYRKQAKTSYIC